MGAQMAVGTRALMLVTAYGFADAGGFPALTLVVDGTPADQAA